MARFARLACSGVLFAVIVGCAPAGDLAAGEADGAKQSTPAPDTDLEQPPGAPEGGTDAADGGTPDTKDDGPAGGTATPADRVDGRSVVAEDGRLVLRGDGAPRTLVTLDDERDGEIVHVAVRPGRHETTTVLALARVEERYELRYLVIDGDTSSDLYWFPWRLQIDEELRSVRDVPPIPVWAPDGSAVAWVEWDAHATRLRVVRWMSEAGANNPSDETATYRLAEVPAGTQLERWETTSSPSTLVGTDGEVGWRIQLVDDDKVSAMPVGRPVQDGVGERLGGGGHRSP